MAHMVGVVDDSPVYRSGLARALEDHDFDVVEMYEVHLRRKVPLDVLVIGASGSGGRKLIRGARSDYPTTPIIAIVPSSWDGLPLHAAVLADGAVAAVSREAPKSVIVSAVSAVLDDWAVLVLPGEESRAFSMLFQHVLDDDPEPMTEDERLLLLRLFQGATRPALAEEFHFALRTVDRRIQDVYRKLNASHHTDAVLRALLWGYLTRSVDSRDGS